MRERGRPRARTPRPLTSELANAGDHAGHDGLRRDLPGRSWASSAATGRYQDPKGQPPEIVRTIRDDVRERRCSPSAAGARRCLTSPDRAPAAGFSARRGCGITPSFATWIVTRRRVSGTRRGTRVVDVGLDHAVRDGTAEPFVRAQRTRPRAFCSVEMPANTVPCGVPVSSSAFLERVVAAEQRHLRAAGGPRSATRAKVCASSSSQSQIIAAALALTQTSVDRRSRISTVRHEGAEVARDHQQVADRHVAGEALAGGEALARRDADGSTWVARSV